LAAGSRHSDIFSIEPDTGFILAKVPLDRELKDSYELLVVASDNGYEPRSGSATVRVQVKDENDNPPAVHQPGGTLRTNAKFDREAVSSYTIQVRAQDRGSQPLKTDREVVIRILDVNDQAPVIVSPGNNSQPTKISIYTHRVGSLVMRVRAEDGDDGLNGQIVYSLTQQQARNKFSIDASTGEIRVAQPLDLADLNRYKLMVQARDCAPTNPKVIYIDVDDSAPPVNLLDEAELAAAHTRRNVIIIIILAAVSAVLAIILIVAITCVNRPCCGVYEGGASGAGGRGKHRGGRQRRTDGIDGMGGGGGGGDMQYTEQAQHLTVTDSEMAWAGSGVLRAPSIGSPSPIVTTSFALPQSHDASCYYGGGGGGGGGGACSTLPNPRHQVAGERSASRGGAQASRPGQAKSDQVNFWLYQIKEDAAASPQMQHP
uniref:Cadherin domain-containing protein n=1 Tax=Macrostomum lignano TaxID=282301 RepID=A0A1I8IPI6_9PLAT